MEIIIDAMFWDQSMYSRQGSENNPREVWGQWGAYATIEMTTVMTDDSNNDMVLGSCDDMGQESAYMCKLPELPPGTSKGFLHFVQYKGSTQSQI
jgi:recombinational DNA repair protein RecT